LLFVKIRFDRATEDVDLVIDCEVAEAIELIEKLDEHGFAPFFPEVEQVVRQSYILALEDQTSKIKLDLAVGCSGFEKLVVQRAEDIEVSGSHIRVATPEDLIIMKVMAGRAQDEQDIKGMLVVHSRSIDWRYCIDTSQQLQEALGIDLVGRIPHRLPATSSMEYWSVENGSA